MRSPLFEILLSSRTIPWTNNSARCKIAWLPEVQYPNLRTTNCACHMIFALCCLALVVTCAAHTTPRWGYVGTTKAVVRFPYRNGDMRARGLCEHIMDLPDEGHNNRDVLFESGGHKMLVTIPSFSNADDADGPLKRTAQEYSNVIPRFRCKGLCLRHSKPVVSSV